jgi:hypothetical protein
MGCDLSFPKKLLQVDGENTASLADDLYTGAGPARVGVYWADMIAGEGTKLRLGRQDGIAADVGGKNIKVRVLHNLRTRAWQVA